VYVIFVAPTNGVKYLDNLIQLAAQHHKSVFFIVVSDDISANDYKRLVRTGGADVVTVGGAAHEIRDIIARRSAPTVLRDEADDDTKPVVITFVPSAGGVGNAKLATEVGVRLKTAKATRERRICLVDLDLQTSHVCTYLDLEPKLRIDEIASYPERLDAHLFEIFKSAHTSGLDVIAAPRGKFNYNDLMVEALDALFEMASKRYDLILIDLPVTWFSWTFDLIFNSDALIVTGLNTVPCLHQIVETLTAIRSHRSDPVPLSVVINRCERRLFGGVVRQQHVQQVLGREKIFFVRDDPKTMADSINTGTPIVTNFSGSKVAKELAALATYCGEIKSLQAARQSASPAPQRAKVVKTRS
jgi:pilus assembly protein CpaE